MSVSQKQIDALLSLSGEDRYRHFIKVVVDAEEAWGLYHNGWAMACTDDNDPVFLFWPAEEYANLCAVDEWKGYQPRPIPLEYILESLLPNLRLEGSLPGVFYTPSGNGVTPSIEQLEGSLREEMSRY
jgi:hypothetical protein